MKKLAILLVLALCLTLCGCPATEDTPQTPGQPVIKEVHITAGKIEPGMTAKDVLVEVTIDNQPVACRVQLTGFAADGYWEMAEDEPVPENFFVRLDVFYSLPKGYDVDQINVTMECDGGEYDGTGSISNDAEGNIEAWSHAFYGTEPVAPETPPSDEDPQPITPPQPQPQHTHSWTEVPGPGIVDCTIPYAKNYKCSCGETKSETIPAPGHDTKDNVTIKKATCVETGSETYRCKRCSYVLVVEIPATGHTWSGWTHKTGLVHNRTCSTCGAEETQNHNIPAGDVICTDCGAAIIN